MVIKKHNSHKNLHATQHRRLTTQVSLGLIISLVAASGIYAVFLSHASGPVQTVQSVVDVGAVGMPSNVSARDGGASALIGGRMTWVFGDTFYQPNSGVKVEAPKYVSASSGISNLATPTLLSGTQDSRGVPSQLIPYTDAEKAGEIAPNNRYALWPGSVVAETNGTSGIVFYNTTHILPSGWVGEGTGIARIAAGQTVATRLPGLLFSASEPSFRKPLVVGDTLYLYAACGQAKCQLARVPLSQMTNRGAYTFWDGKGWNANVAAAAASIPASNFGFSFMYNSYLKQYVQAFIPNYSHGLYFRYADNPQGPWTDGTKVADLDANLQVSLPNMHPEISGNGGQVVYVSYARDLKNFKGDIRLLKISYTGATTGSTTTTTAAATAAAKRTAAAKQQAEAEAKQQAEEAAKTEAASEETATAEATVGSETVLVDDSKPVKPRSWTDKFKEFWLGIWYWLISPFTPNTGVGPPR